MENKNIRERTERTRWFRDARFGMFIHWGLYSILLADGSEIKPGRYWNLAAYPEHAFFFLNQGSFDSYPLPDPKDTVVEITLKE